MRCKISPFYIHDTERTDVETEEETETGAERGIERPGKDVFGYTPPW